MIWFTSDTHFNHRNICRGTTSWKSGQVRDFETLDDMNDTIIKNINDVVSEDDTLYHLGDFAFGNHKLIPVLRSRIKCNDIRLIFGNHDGRIIENRDYQSVFTWCKHYKEITEFYEDQKYHLCLFHFSLRVWHKNHKGSVHLFGHSHSNLVCTPDELGKSMDVGVDTNDYKPYSLADIVKIMKQREIVALDHHNEESD